VRTAYQTQPEELSELTPGEPRYRADQLRRWLYRHPVLTPDGMTNLPATLRESLRDRLWPFHLETELSADDGRTRKWLFRTIDGASIETVVMGYRDRTTICISSQAGCAMGCTFCATGQFGFERHLDAGEIVAQVAYANAAVRQSPLRDAPDRVTNVVFMGMGEPLANYRNVRESLHRIIDVIDLSARAVTVSTVGVVPGIDQLAAEPWQVGLAVSLHAADDELRSELIPLNRRYPLEAVIAASERFFRSTGRRISIEWTLMAGSNDTPRQAVKLAAIATRLQAHVNVIAMNPTPLTTMQAPGRDTIDAFMTTLRDHGANATFRDTRGKDIDAACGQLRLRAATRSTKTEKVP
jgi:23S rRNA (adenine2503-C2)-methyltransferase